MILKDPFTSGVPLDDPIFHNPYMQLGPVSTNLGSPKDVIPKNYLVWPNGENTSGRNVITERNIIHERRIKSISLITGDCVTAQEIPADQMYAFPTLLFQKVFKLGTASADTQPAPFYDIQTCLNMHSLTVIMPGSRVLKNVETVGAEIELVLGVMNGSLPNV
ncbi:hypothetical protein Bbelb_042110 [Branchiostoma belcheri]|nr:hypothetical protein Bbelb_042110 [Branchiostoma belcheri]